jgi:hypothetical protein
MMDVNQIIRHPDFSIEGIIERIHHTGIIYVDVTSNEFTMSTYTQSIFEKIDSIDQVKIYLSMMFGYRDILCRYNINDRIIYIKIMMILNIILYKYNRKISKKMFDEIAEIISICNMQLEQWHYGEDFYRWFYQVCTVFIEKYPNLRCKEIYKMYENCEYDDIDFITKH